MSIYLQNKQKSCKMKKDFKNVLDKYLPKSYGSRVMKKLKMEPTDSNKRLVYGVRSGAIHNNEIMNALLEVANEEAELVKESNSLIEKLAHEKVS